MAQDLLLNVLAATLSSNAHERRPAEDQLKSWQTTPGFHESLLSVVEARSMPIQIRIQAALTFKNGLDKWRKTAPNCISVESKNAIRSRILHLLDEDNLIIAKALTLSIGKIARLDYEGEWPSLPDELLQLVARSLQDSSKGIQLHRSLMATKQVIKALIENRMPRGRKLMQKIGPMLFTPLSKLYNDYCNALLPRLANFDPGALQEISFQVMVLAQLTNILRYIFSDGWMNVDLHAEPKDWFLQTVPHAMQFFQHRTALAYRSDPSLHSLLDLLNRQLRAYGKLYNKEERRADLSRPIFEYCWAVLTEAGRAPHLISEDLSSVFPTKIVVQAIVIIRGILILWPSTEFSSNEPMSDHEHVFHEQLKTWSRECSIMLVTKFIPMQDADLELWNDDPEAWLNEEEADRDEIDLRPASIRLLESMLSQFRTVVAPTLIGMLAADEMKRPKSKHDILVKEALYGAIGRHPTNILDALKTYKSFEAWLEEDLTADLMSNDPSYHLVKRRIVWLLGGWVGEEIEAETKGEIYRLLLHFLRPSPGVDLATRLTAARTLGKCDSWGFSEKVFTPYLEEVVSLLLALMDEVQTIDSRIRLMETLGVLISRMGNAIAPFADSIMQMLPRLWTSAGDQNQFKVTILSVVADLAEAVGEQSASIQPQLCALIGYGVNPAMDDYAFLHEEAIALWRTAVRFSSRLSPELLNLLPFLVHLLQAGTDTLPHALKLLEGYCLLDAAATLQPYALPFFVAFETVLGNNLRVDSVKLILHTFNMITMLAPPSIWLPALENSNCFIKLVLPFQSPESALTLSKYLCSLSRVVVADTQGFDALITSTASKLSTSRESLLSVLMDAWVDLNDNIGSARHRKLVAIALSHLCVTSDPLILSRLPFFIPMWCSVLAETEETDDGDAVAYSLMDAYDSEGEYDTQDSPEYDRRTQLRNTDPVHSKKMSLVIQQNIVAAQGLNGGADAFQARYLAGIDPLVLEELMQRLSGQLKG